MADFYYLESLCSTPTHLHQLSWDQWLRPTSQLSRRWDQNKPFFLFKKIETFANFWSPLPIFVMGLSYVDQPIHTSIKKSSKTCKYLLEVPISAARLFFYFKTLTCSWNLHNKFFECHIFHHCFFFINLTILLRTVLYV